MIASVKMGRVRAVFTSQGQSVKTIFVVALTATTSISVAWTWIEHAY